MQRDVRFRVMLLVLLGVQLLAMWLLPLADTSEPRYAETARMMAETGDWITPWFSPGVPFWGKPPLSFWAQAFSMRVLGVSEFAVRLPSWLATVAALWLLYQTALTLYGRESARRAVLIYLSFALVFLSAGAVLTDPYLALGTMLCMTGWLMAGRRPTLFWRYSFFLGLAVGMLAKGPLIFLLVGGVLVPWLVVYKPARATFAALPWLRGSALTLLLSLPWYLAAEWKTPGFLDYFIIGEHIRRFIVPGWSGDLYGTAHEAMRGTIWYYWLQASFPWGLVVIGLLVKALASRRGRMALWRAAGQADTAYFLGWALFTPVFFTFSGNILWTYILPALGGLSMLLARAWSALALQPRVDSRAGARIAAAGFRPALGRAAYVALLPAVVVSGLVVASMVNPSMMKSEKSLISFVREQAPAGTPLYYLDDVPFSARFYSAESAMPISEAAVEQKVDQGQSVWVAVPRQKSDHGVYAALGERLLENKRYVLYKLERPADDVALRTRQSIDQEHVVQ